MSPMNPKSAFALSWFAVIVNVLGHTALMLGGQFIFSAIAAVLALMPAIFARKVPQVFGGAVLVASLVLAVTGYPEYKEGMAKYKQRRAKATSSTVSVPSVTKQEERNDRGVAR